jgi:hypothetical protein
VNNTYQSELKSARREIASIFIYSIVPSGFIANVTNALIKARSRQWIRDRVAVPLHKTPPEHVHETRVLFPCD